jgi:PAS domain S-box-containing protein
MKRCFVLFVCLLSLLYTIVFCIAVSADDSTSIRVGVYENRPKIFTDEKGTVSGFWPDIIEYIASEEGWDIEYVHGTWAQCMERLVNGEIDVMPDVAFAEERNELFDFSTETVYVSWSRVYTKKEADIQSILDLEGKNVAVLEGSINVEGPEGIKVLARAFDVSCTFLEVDSYTRVFELVKSGEADAGVASKDFGSQHKAEYNLVHTGIIFQPSLLYFAFPRESLSTPYLVERIDSHIKELKNNGESLYYQSMETWFAAKPIEKPVIPKWILWTLIVIGSLVVLLAGGSYILKSRVNARTKELVLEVIERKKAEDELKRTYRALNTLSLCNQELVRTTNVPDLLQRICEVIVDTGGYRLVWVGFTGNDEEKTVLPVAYYGYEADYLKTVEVTWADTERGKGPTGTAIRTGTPSIARNMLNDPHYAPWRDEAIKRGYASSIALPLISQGQTLGALSIYATEADSFDEKEVDLLVELSNDLAYGITSIRIKTERDKAEESLKAYLENAPDGVYISDVQGTFLYGNRRAEEISSYAKEELIGKSFLELNLLPDAYVAKARNLIRLNASGKATGPDEFQLVRKDGSTICVEISATPIGKDGEITVVGIVRDITERKKSEEEIVKGYQKLQKSLQDTTQAIASTLEMRDLYTAGHQQRVTELACAIAAEIGLAEEQITGLRIAGSLHDIGKMQVPAEILSKPGRLTELEFGIIKTHPQAGYDVLKLVEFPWPVAQIVLQHHERLDGSGYPSGLSGKDIIIEARILAVADVVEAMASHRPYRPAVGVDKALEEIFQKSGILYDADVVDACLKLFNEKGFEFSKDI